MSVFDMILAAVILCAAGWVFYRAFVKKEGSCAGCSGCTCGKSKEGGNDRLMRLS